MRKKWIHVFNYIVLFFILVLTVFLFWIVRDDKTMQMLVGILLSILYVAWGMVYHAMQGSLYPKIVIEYLLVGAIAVIVIATVVWV